MLLAIDIGNTHSVLGLFEGETLAHHWRVATSVSRTSDEAAILLRELHQLGAVQGEISQAILASVVPGASGSFIQALEQYFGTKPLVVGPGIRSGMPILAENPKEVGADRIVNAVAAYEQSKQAVIVVDFGTATTFDCISPAGEYLGGAIAPGLGISADALYQHAAKLPRVPIEQPSRVIGRNTVTSMQSGLYYGYVGLVDGVVARMLEEVDFPCEVVATGGLAELIVRASNYVTRADELLTLKGLKLIYDRNS